MDSLFDEQADQAREQGAPLAARMRPRSLDEFVGQSVAVGPGTLLRRSIERDELTPFILYGPPGTGKTSLARIIAGATRAHFAEVSAVTSGVADIRAAIEGARRRLGETGQRTILFVDEIHRFSKSQQDALLHAVEDNLVVLVGATTENPFFEVNAPLISRSRVVELTPLSDEDVRAIIRRALVDERGLAGAVGLQDDAEDLLVKLAGGDARVALSTLEFAASSAGVSDASVESGMRLTADDIVKAAPTRILPYDKDGDVHYDVISAFIKSMRGSDPDAAVYWLARMMHGGEDPKFIARRILIFASEDIGNADPQALLVAHAAVKAAEFIGWPECRINLAQAAVYMALASKSNASIVAVDKALAEVREGPARPVPNHLRDRSNPGARQLGRGEGYIYPHSHPEQGRSQRYLPEGLERGGFWKPGSQGWEAKRTNEPSTTADMECERDG
ncbi:MAG: replication-associated recombination protein A [Coriobacteriia bacterium]|nr:replication-associated recombination protein A [Coriobacteriia bacterium]